MARLLLLAGVLLLARPAVAWNAAGHRLVAAIAWQQMTEAERDAVAAMLAAHADAGRWEKQIHPGEDHALGLFLAASTWPDDIRGDPRFHDEGSEEPTPLLPGFPDMARHRGWHYLNLPVGEVRRHGAPAGELDHRLRLLVETLTDPGVVPAQRAYALAWLIHLVGDIHQPLHVATRHDASGEDDAGGNGLAVFAPENTRKPDTNLHAWWDDLPGPPWLRGSRLMTRAETLRRQHPAGAAAAGTPALDTDLWRDESYVLAKGFVYAPWLASAPVMPVSLDADYRRQARRLVDERVATAGDRLARLLTSLLAPPSAAHEAKPPAASGCQGVPPVCR